METTAAPTHINRLSRSRSNRYLGGVAGGLGHYFGIDPVIFRILFVALTLAGASGLALYMIAWLLVPDDGAEQSILGRRFAAGQRGRTMRIVVLAVAAFLVALMLAAAGALAIVAASSDVPFRGGSAIARGRRARCRRCTARTGSQPATSTSTCPTSPSPGV